jgi:ribosomal protein S6 kinase alpha-5
MKVLNKRHAAKKNKMKPTETKIRGLEKENRTIEETETEIQVLEAVRQGPFLVTLHYSFQSDDHLYLILGEYISLCA